MKLLYKLIMFIGVVGIMSSCGDPEDQMTSDALEGGAVIKLTASSSGKALGIPFPTGGVGFTDVELSMTPQISIGGFNVTSYEIVKSFNGGSQVAVASSATLPFTVTYTTIEEYVNGLGVAVTDLELGDVFTFSVIMYLPDGRRIQAAPGDGDIAITVNCSSDLAGDYTMTGLRDDGATYTFPVVITEVSAGNYQSSRSGSWGPGALGTPTGEATMIWSDNCGVLSIPDQNLGDWYSNMVWGNDIGTGNAGAVDPATGTITYAYEIEFGSGNRIYTETLTPN